MRRVVHTPLEDIVRRGIDLVLSILALALLSPIMVVIGVLIKRESPGPAVFVQERVGKGGRVFKLRKFRSMRLGAADGPAVTAAGDVRVTAIGAHLRSTKLDELPQLVNVAAGDMSIVGPRPEVPKYASLWPEQDRLQILSVRPGITDPVTVSLRREEQILATREDPERYYVQVLLPEKARRYAEYVRGRTLRGDAHLVWRTLVTVMRG